MMRTPAHKQTNGSKLPGQIVASPDKTPGVIKQDKTLGDYYNRKTADWPVVKGAAAPQPVAVPFRGPCTIKARGGRCMCEAEGLGPECVHRDPLIDGYPLTAGLPPPAAPPAPERKPLTDEQIIAIRKATGPAKGYAQWGDTIGFARAILNAAMQGDK